MKKHGLWVLLFATTIALLMFPAAVTVVAQHQGGSSHHGSSAQNHPGDTQHQSGAAQHQTLKVGRKGEMDFSTETQVGDMTLKPGRYMFQHRVEGEDHFVHFTEVTKANPYSRTGGGVPKATAGEVKCRLEPLGAKASQTEVETVREGGTTRVTKIVVRGENVAHVF